MSAHCIEVRDQETSPWQRRSLWLLGLAIWLLAVMTFNLPGREGPDSAGSLDLLALAKMTSRCAAAALLGLVLLIDPRRAKRKAVVRCMWPFGLFILWALCSVIWSPLRTVSMGHAWDLVVQALLAIAVGVRCNSQQDTSAVLRNLSLILLAITVVLLVVSFVSPSLSGFLMVQTLAPEDNPGLYHPTSSSATASLGIVLLVAAALLWGWRWARVLVVPGTIAHGAALFLAHNRTSILVAMICLVLTALCCGRRFFLATLVLTVSVAATGYMLVDPGLEGMDATYHMTEKYFRRGQTTEQLMGMTARNELWKAVWREFQATPVRGCGYYVTSRKGKIDVWTRPANRDAHNFVLHVLVTTGLVGMSLFLAAFGWPIWKCVTGCRRPVDRKLAVFLPILGCWYLVWGQTEASFMGHVHPETVVFYCAFGLLLSMLAAPSSEEQDAPARSSADAIAG